VSRAESVAAGGQVMDDQVKDERKATLSVRREWAWRLVGLAISLLAVVIVFTSVDVASAMRVLLGANILLLAIVPVILAVQLLVRAWRWTILLPERSDGRPVPILRAVPPLLVGYLANAVLPARLGEAVRALLVARREGLDGLAAFGATLLERVVDVTTLAFIGLAAALAMGVAPWVVGIGALALATGLVILVLVVTVGIQRLVDAADRVLTRLGVARRSRRLLAWMRSLASGLDRGRDIMRLSRATVLSVLIWLLDASLFLVVGWAIGLELTLPQAVVIGAVAVLSTAVPSAPGYAGTFDLAAPATAVALGIPPAESLALALLVHLLTVIPLALAGATAALGVGHGLDRLAQDAAEVGHGQA
jgi:glycosyltransferase 2 family protein